jgi:spore maturation protein CgeB
MKIVYVGILSEEGTCLMRMNTLKKMGHTIIPINTATAEIQQMNYKLWLRIITKLGWPLDTGKINQQLLKIVEQHRPNIIWVDKGLIISKATLLEVKKISPKSKLVHYNPDDPFGSYGKSGWRIFLKGLPYYDVHFVPRKENMIEYQRYRATNVYFLIPTRGFDPNIHYPRNIDSIMKSRWGGDVGFIGSFEKERASYILALAKSGFKIKVWSSFGPWPKHPNIIYENQGVYGEKYTNALSSFKIVLAFLRKKNRDKHTSRSIEIPACGAFMLAERTSEHLALFEEGKEAEFFDSTEELIDKARFYLKHDKLRTQIASAGRERCIKSGYSYHERIKKMLEIVSEIDK